MSLKNADYTVIQRDITRKFDNAALQASPFYPTVCAIVNSNGADEKYAWLGNMPGMKEWLGDRKFEQLRSADYSLANKHWESSLQLAKTDVDDDRIGLYDTVIPEFADEAMYHPDELLFQNVINVGESTACWDGQYFYDTDHAWGDSGTQSNALTYNAADHTAVTTAEFRASFHAALIKMLGYRNDRGKPFLRPRVGKLGNLICRVPLSLYEVATKAFEQIITLDGSAGVSSVVLEKPLVVPVQYMGASYTSGSDARWHLDYVGGRLKPFVFQARQPLRRQVAGATDLETKFLKLMLEARYNIGYLAWFYSVQTTFN